MSRETGCEWNNKGNSIVELDEDRLTIKEIFAVL